MVKRTGIERKTVLDKLPEMDMDSNIELFNNICNATGIKPERRILEDLVIYNMTDGMRTSTHLNGAESYKDGGMFVLRLINFLKILGAKSCYINVIEERHKFRENYSSIYKALNELVDIYKDYARKEEISYKFLGKIDKTLEPKNDMLSLYKKLRTLEEETYPNESFLALYLINYSLDWAMTNLNIFENLPKINITIRHTKFQVPTGMLLPPNVSDYSNIIFVQQGSSSINWSDFQILCLIAISAATMVKNTGTQYLKVYSKEEIEQIRKMREERNHILNIDLSYLDPNKRNNQSKTFISKRAITTSPKGPEIYEF